jgi:hypothetical protein
MYGMLVTSNVAFIYPTYDVQETHCRINVIADGAEQITTPGVEPSVLKERWLIGHKTCLDMVAKSKIPASSRNSTSVI